MDRLATLPLFFPLDGRRIVVIGGSEAAAWKAELLSAAGAAVAVLSPEPCADMEALAADPPGGPVRLERRSWSPSDLDGAALVVAAARDEEEAQAIFAAAAESGVPVNVIDKPGYCTFQFGAIVNRSPLVVGISTGGRRRCSARRSARASRRCCRRASHAGPRPPRRGAPSSAG
jgi:uroporphyrin-III C-methyltransferase/precorrin-2 dehydrogenase/sirohydrochlorin ferrochelatase